MNLASFSIKRPTFILSIIVIILVIGLISLSHLGVDMFPDITIPVISVTTVYRGAGPAEIETLVSKPMEEEMSSMSGIKHVYSYSQDGYSVVVAFFNLGTDIKVDEQMVRDKVSLVKSKLPKDTDEPVIRRFDPADAPVIMLGLSAQLSGADLYDLANEELKPQLERIPNVAVIDITGGTKREIRVELDKAKLREHEVSVSQVVGAIGGNSQNVPAGKISKGGKESLIRTVGEYRSLDQIKSTVVNFFGSDVPVTVARLGEIHDTTEDVQNYAFLNGKSALSLGIYRQSGSNTVSVADNVIKRVGELNKELAKRPGKPQMTLIRDSAKPIRMNILDVEETIFLGILLTLIVVYYFLGNFRSTFITIVALPNSLIGAFILMYLMGFTINMITLMSLSLAVGLLIDDAIVVRENIWRHLELGQSPKEAAIKGTKQVTLAVIATTLTVISVFAPVGFLGGMVGQFFRQMGFTVVFAMAISFMDAMTTAPLLSAYLVKEKSKKRKGEEGLWCRICAPIQASALAFGRFQERLVEGYEKVIGFCLKHRFLVVGSALGLFVASLFLIPFIKASFMPSHDMGFYGVTLEAKPGTSLDSMKKYALEIEGIVRSHKENETVYTTVGDAQGEPTVASIYVEMVQEKQRKINTPKMKDLIRKELEKYAFLSPSVSDISMGYGAEKPFQMILVGDDLNVLAPIAEKVRVAFSGISDLKDVTIDYRPGKPEMQVVMDAERMKTLGVSTVSAGMELRTMVDGAVPAKFKVGDREYDIRVRLQEDQRDISENFGSYYISNMNRNNIRLANVAHLAHSTGPTKISRRDRVRFITVEANVSTDGTANSGVNKARALMAKMALPAGVSFEFVGQTEDFVELFHNIVIAMGLSVLFMYFILASLYESLIMPFLIMMALPLGIIGALVALWATNSTLNIFSMIGFVMLLGLVAKNSILIVDYAQRLVRTGMPRKEAIIRAGRIRLRPILMTSIALIAGMLPLALALTEVGRFRTSMGVAIIGGLITSTVLTLLVIPSAFIWFDDLRLWLRKIFGRPLLREIDQVEKEQESDLEN